MFENLRAWRLQVAQANSLPAFVIFTDATLMAIAEANPSEVAGLGLVSGVGANKLERYGEAILAILGRVTGSGTAESMISRWSAASCGSLLVQARTTWPLTCRNLASPPVARSQTIMASAAAGTLTWSKAIKIWVAAVPAAVAARLASG